MVIDLLIKMAGIAVTLAALAWFLFHLFHAAGRHRWLITLPTLGGLCALGFCGLASGPDTDADKTPATSTATPGAAAEKSQYREQETLLPPAPEGLPQKSGKKASIPLIDEGAELLEKNPQCGKIKWRDVSDDEGTAAQPVFLYLCNPKHNVVFQVLVSEKDIQKAIRSAYMPIVEPLGEAKALETCNHWIDTQTRGWNRHEVVWNSIHAYANGTTHVKRRFFRVDKNKNETPYAVDCLVAVNGKVAGKITK